MSEQRLNYMQELDLWTETNVINPLHESITEGDGADCDEAVEQIKKAIRTKVLESYRNGQAAGPAKPRSAFRPRGK